MSAHETPLGLVLVICDQVIADEKTQKKTLVGAFNQVSLDKFPGKMPPFTVYVALTNGNGQLNASLRCFHEATGAVAMQMMGPLHFPGPMHVVEIAFKCANVAMPAEGVYCLEFAVDDVLIFQRRFVVKRNTPQEPQA